MSSFLTLCVLLLFIGFVASSGAMILFSLAGICFSAPYLLLKRLFFS